MYTMPSPYTPMQRIERMKVSMINNHRMAHLAGILMIGNLHITREYPTAATNGRDVFFNPEFVNTLTDPELRAVLYHEYGGHIMYRHLSTFRHLYKEDAQLANVACDYVINQVIADMNDPMFICLPDGGLQDDKYRGLDSVQVFNMLKSDKDSGKPVPNDSMDTHDWDGAKDIDEDDTADTKQEIESAIRQGVVASKLLGNATPLDVERMLNPSVPWREALRDLLTTFVAGHDYATYHKPKRRWLSQDMLMPTHRGDAMGTLVIAADMSYSIDSAMQGVFISEIASLCELVRPERVDIIYWGSSVVNHETYDRSQQEEIARVTVPKCGGGTDVTCVTAYIEVKDLNPDCVVVLTDGYLGGSWGEWGSVPVVWAMTTDRIAKVGTTIRLTM